jgi:hypothetical protein
MESVKDWKEGLWRAPIRWQWYSLICIRVWETLYIYLYLPAQLKLCLVDSKEVVTQHFWLHRLSTLVIPADEHLIFGIYGDEMLQAGREGPCRAARAARHRGSGAEGCEGHLHWGLMEISADRGRYGHHVARASSIRAQWRRA